MNPVIRPARLDDLARIEAIVEDAYRPYVARIGREPGPMLDDYAARTGAGQVHVIEVDGVVQGFVVLLPEAGTLLLDNVAVAAMARGQGFGRRLLDFAERFAVEGGLPIIRLYTHELMTENQAMYRARGYAETGRFEEHGLRRVFMAKRLEAGPA